MATFFWEGGGGGEVTVCSRILTYCNFSNISHFGFRAVLWF